MLTVAFVDEKSREAGLGLPFRKEHVDAVALDDDRIKTATTVTVGTDTIFEDADLTAHVDTDRNVNFTVVSEAGAVHHSLAFVDGINQFGRQDSEMLVSDAVARVEGSKIWKPGTLMRVRYRVVGAAGASASLKLGVGNKLGIGTRIGEDDDVALVTQAGTADVVVVDKVNSSILPTTLPNAAIDYVITGRSTFGLQGSLGA
jgi:hypothetical protein